MKEEILKFEKLYCSKLLFRKHNSIAKGHKTNPFIDRNTKRKTSVE